MFSLNSSDRYLLYTGDCDMRRGAYSLSGLVRNKLRRNPLNCDVFVFLNRRRTCINYSGGSLVALFSLANIWKKVLTQGRLPLAMMLFCHGRNWC